jgi:hypothetical protein
LTLRIWIRCRIILIGPRPFVGLSF